ncbi:MAG TPA: hypothetical protein VNZ43_01295 [Sphingomonadaceae bacterium]|nr:hypothetical protein [Sphingomonadaceae bacterium]
MSERRLLDLDGLYAAIEDDSSLETLASSVAAACGTRSAMISYENAQADFHLARMNYWPSAAYLRYFAEFAEGDPWLAVVNPPEIAGRALSFDDLLPPARFVETAMFNELFLPLGDDTGRCLGIIAPRGSDGLTMGVHRALGDREFTPLDAARLNDVYGHLRRVLRLRALLGKERRDTARVQAMLDASDRGMLLVDGKLTILRASAEALRCIDLRDGLSCRQGRLHCASPAVEGDIRKAVQATIDRLPVACSAFLCERPSGRMAFRLVILPAGLRGDAGALIFIDDIALRRDRDRIRWLRDAYHLSAAETALAEGLLTGESIDEVAARRGVGRETVRSQLKALFVKTATRRQADLVRLLVQMPGSAQ